MVIHVIQPGDSIYSLEKRYGVPMYKIIADNNLLNTERLMVGQTIVVDTDSIRHLVAPGQTLDSIAREYGTSVQEILDANPEITDPSSIKAGQIIIIPLGNYGKLGTIDVNGYAFPNINRTVLENTLPNLTFLSIFAYHVRANGSLIPISDSSLILEAKRSGVAPMMVLANIIEAGGFDSDLARIILSSDEVQENLINNVITVLNEKGYYGLNIDFEYVYPQDKEKYDNFLRKITDRLRKLGYFVTTALAPKTSSDQKGLLYEAHDYAFSGELFDQVILMTYEWGFTYGMPQAVSPLDEVEKVLNYAVSVIPSEKILMGIPNYGYDWTLPYVQGTAARSLSNVDAASLASTTGSRIMFDNMSQTPFFTYYDNDRTQHVVWFEDARSIAAKLSLVDKFNLGGVSFWTINNYFPQTWIVLNAMYDVRKIPLKEIF